MFVQRLRDEIKKYASDGTGVSIYALCHPKTGDVLYIGKANVPSERMKSHMRDVRRKTTPIYRWIAKNGKPKMEILADGCLDWASAERSAISFARESGVKIFNIADGGDQPPLLPFDTLVKNAHKATALRPRYIMRLFRRLECNVRNMEIRKKVPYEKGRHAIEILRETVDFCRKNGTLNDLNEVIRVKFEWSL